GGTIDNQGARLAGRQNRCFDLEPPVQVVGDAHVQAFSPGRTARDVSDQKLPEVLVFAALCRFPLVDGELHRGLVWVGGADAIHTAGGKNGAALEDGSENAVDPSRTQVFTDLDAEREGSDVRDDQILHRLVSLLQGSLDRSP